MSKNSPIFFVYHFVVGIFFLRGSFFPLHSLVGSRGDHHHHLLFFFFFFFFFFLLLTPSSFSSLFLAFFFSYKYYLKAKTKD